MKRKLANKLLAILLSAAMAVTVLPQTNVFAIEAGESEIAVEEIAVTDLAEQTGEDSADVESETEEDADARAAVSENRLDAEDVKDADVTEDDCICVETVGDGSRENPFVVKEGEATELTFAVRGDDDWETAYISFTPSKTGIYTYSYDGADAIYDSDIYCDAGFEPLVFAGQSYTYCLENNGNNKSNLNVTIKFSLKKEYTVGEKVTIDAEKNKNASIVVKGNTIYPVVFSKTGKYTVTAMDSTKKQSVNYYDELLKRQPLGSWGDTDKVTAVPITKNGELYYFSSEEDNVLSVAYSEYDVGRILRTFKIKKNVEVTDNGKIII